MEDGDKNTVMISLYISRDMAERIQKALDRGYYVSKSDLIRHAVNKELERLGL